MASYFEDHNIVRKVTEIQHNYSYEEVEKLDELITAGMKCAKEECRNATQLPWSPEIHKIVTQVNILILHLSSLRNRINCDDQIEKKQQSLKVPQPVPPTVKESSALLKDLQKQVRKLWKEFQLKRTTVLEDQEEAYVASRPDMCPKRAARIFKNFKESSEIYSELPSKRHKGGDLNTIEVQLPLEGETL